MKTIYLLRAKYADNHECVRLFTQLKEAQKWQTNYVEVYSAIEAVIYKTTNIYSGEIDYTIIDRKYTHKKIGE